MLWKCWTGLSGLSGMLACWRCGLGGLPSSGRLDMAGILSHSRLPFLTFLSLIIARDPPRPVRDRPCQMWVAPVGRDGQRYTCHPGGLDRSQFDDRFI